MPAHGNALVFGINRLLCEFDFRYNAEKLKDGDRSSLAIHRNRWKRLLLQDSRAAGSKDN
jgi:hypothetical protein